MSGRSPAAILYDSSGNPVSVVQDGSDYRLAANAKMAKGASDLVHLDALDTVAGVGRLKATLYSPSGEPLSLGTVPSTPASINNAYVLNSGSPNLRVDGSSVPVVFSYDADPTQNISIQEIKFVLVSNSIPFGSGNFGAISGPLTNGVLVEVVAGGSTGTVHNLTRNEDLVDFASPGGFQWVVSSKDLLATTYLVGGGLTLVAGSADKVRVTVRDNITSAGVHFQCFVKANKLS